MHQCVAPADGRLPPCALAPAPPQNAPRIARALFEIVLRNKWASAAATLLEMCKVRRAAPLGGCLPAVDLPS